MKQPAKSAQEFVPTDRTLSSLQSAAKACQGCDLYRHAIQTVFGKGPENAKVVFVGEQPGDMEDQLGQPFVGPAGKMLHKLISEAGIDLTKLYFTNAVKHFKFEEKGKRRIHSTPRVIEVRACYPWLQAEVETIKPDIIVCLGSTAVNAVFGKTLTIASMRGQLVDSPLGPKAFVTVHPSSILRMPDEASRETQRDSLLADLKALAKLI